ncbi:hypothetical protein [Psychromicrobium lacuslunae]|uniref:hypothetical protein n=1 Tax=Psychromicrobium lacuslunae TaxID=1618207 RepID=UPI0012FED8F4|nr:hypothetical protein [Psychromicrobium lacuslunae]
MGKVARLLVCLAAAALCFSLSSCAAQKVTEDQLIGSWAFDQSRGNKSESTGGTLSFEKNGVLVLNGTPENFFIGNYTDAHLNQLKAEWKIGDDKFFAGDDVVEISAKSPSGGFKVPLTFEKSGDEYFLMVTPDPDQPPGFYFKKVRG